MQITECMRHVDLGQGNPTIHSQYGVNYSINGGESKTKVIPIKFSIVHLVVNRIGRREGEIQYNSMLVDALRPGRHGGAVNIVYILAGKRA